MTPLERITLEALDLFDDLINGNFSAVTFNRLCAELRAIDCNWESVGDLLRAEESKMLVTQ